MVMDAVFKLTFLLSYPESRDAITSINVPVTSIKLGKYFFMFVVATFGYVPAKTFN